VDEKVIDFLPEELKTSEFSTLDQRPLGKTGPKLKFISKYLPKAWREEFGHFYSPRKFQKAEALLEKYAQAKLVITSRLHCALPCIALGTPIIFIPKDITDVRYSGYLDILDWYEMGGLVAGKTTLEVKKQKNKSKVDKFKKDLTKTCEDFIKEV
jgi:exopolysaccharide biosynthesis predicted pyruvyltransferase EpsI